MTMLSGIRVIECGVAIAAPTATRYLAHLGAEVIKVDQPASKMRAFGGPAWAPRDIGPGAADLPVGANATNSQKRSLAINLKHPDGMSAFRRLVATADVFVSNLSLGAIESLGLDWEQLRGLNPRLIHLVMPGFGTTGPYKDFKSWGPNLSSFSGYDSLTGFADREPVMPPVPLPDYISGYHAVVALLAALEYRARSGEGQCIEMGQFMATVACLGHEAAFASLGGEATRDANRAADAAPRGVFPCRGNDRWVAISVRSDDAWRALLALQDIPPALRDSRMDTLPGRKQHEDEIDALLATWTQARTNREVATRLQAAGIASAPLQDAWDHATDPHLESRGYWKLVSHRRLGVDIVNSLPFQLDATPLVYQSAAPPLGDDTREVLMGAGIPPADAADLIEQGVAAEAAPCDLPGIEDTPGRPWFRWAMPLIKPSPGSEDVMEIDDWGIGAGAPGGDAALNGLRVIDMSDARSAYGSRLLAALGATVTRLDPPGSTDARGVAPCKDGVSLFHQYADAGKHVVQIDHLATDTGREAFIAAIADADVLYESHAPGYLESLGLGPAALMAINPRLSVVSVTPFGQYGPYSNWNADDLTLWALSGMLQITGYPDRPPVGPGGLLAHYLVGVHGALSAIAAVIARRRTGRGQHVDVSAHEVLVTTSGPNMLPALEDQAPRRRAGSRALGMAPWGFYHCQDGLVSLLALFPDHWEILAAWIHEVTGDEGALDPKYRGAPSVRFARVDEVTVLVNSLARGYTAADFCVEAQRRGVPAAPVYSVGDTLHDPHLKALDYWRTATVPGLGEVTFPGPPFQLTASPLLRDLAPPG